MSASQPASSADQEMDLTDVFALFQRIFYKCLALCFKAIHFIFKFWWIILLLIIGGAALGYFTKGKPKYESTLILKTNFNSQPYVYNAIKQFDDNLSENDAGFIKAAGLDINNLGVTGLEITPIIDVVSLIGGDSKISDRALSTVIKELDVSDDTEIFATDRFYSNYKYHTLTIGTSDEKGKEDISKVIAYINSQPFIKKVSEEGVKNMIDRIAKSDLTLEQTDLMINSYVKNSDVTNEVQSDELSFFNNQNNLNLNGVLAFKSTLITEIEALKNDLVTSSEAAVIVSDIQVNKTASLKDKKEVLYPILFVFLFLFFAGVRFTYLSLKKELQAKHLLD